MSTSHLKKLIWNGKILVAFYIRVLRCKSSQAEACYILQDILRNDQSLELLFCGHETQKKINNNISGLDSRLARA